MVLECTEYAGFGLLGTIEGIIIGNTIHSMGYSLWLSGDASGCSIFGNNINPSYDADALRGEDPGCRVGSVSPPFYRYRSRYFKRDLGNFYSDYNGTDADGDGVGDTPYVGQNCQDDHPLVGTRQSFAFLGWALSAPEGIGELHANDFTQRGAIVPLRALSGKIFSAPEPSSVRWVFRGGSQADGTTWTGWLTFASPLPAGHTVEATFGIGDPGGVNFKALGPAATITGNGEDYILHFVAPEGALVLPEGKALALRLTNTGAADLELMTGGAAGMIFAPAGSRPPEMTPALLRLLFLGL